MQVDFNQTKPKSGRGGSRQNSGRKKGSQTKKTRELAEQALAEGISPVAVMYKAMRAHVEYAESLGDPEKSLRVLKDAALIGRDAAPYSHPRLSAIEHTGAGGKPLLEKMPEKDLVSRMHELLAKHPKLLK